jgi:hypothetical protein
MPTPLVNEEDWWQTQRKAQTTRPRLAQGVYGIPGVEAYTPPVRNLANPSGGFNMPEDLHDADPRDLDTARGQWEAAEQYRNRRPMRAIMNGQEYAMPQRMASPKSDIALKMIENARADRIKKEDIARKEADEKRAWDREDAKRMQAREDAAAEDQRKLAYLREATKIQNEMAPSSEVKRQRALAEVEEIQRGKQDRAAPHSMFREQALASLPADENIRAKYEPQMRVATTVADVRRLSQEAAAEAGSRTPGKLLGETTGAVGDVASTYAASLQAAIDKNDTERFQQIISAMEEDAVNELAVQGLKPDPAKVKAMLQRKLLQMGIRRPEPGFWGSLFGGASQPAASEGGDPPTWSSVATGLPMLPFAPAIPGTTR